MGWHPIPERLTTVAPKGNVQPEYFDSAEEQERSISEALEDHYQVLEQIRRYQDREA